MWCQAVQQTGVSRHTGEPIEGPLEIARTLQHYRIEGFKEALICPPIMLRDISLSYS